MINTQSRCLIFRSFIQAHFSEKTLIVSFASMPPYTNHTSNPNPPLTPQLPLVINTHGWIKGLGLDVLIDILRYTVPTHVVDVQSAKANKNLPPGNFWETTMEPLSRVHYIPTAVPDQVDARYAESLGSRFRR